MRANRLVLRILSVTTGWLLAGGVTLRADDPPADTKGPHAEEIARADNDFCRLSLSDGAVKSFDRYMAAECIDPISSLPAAATKAKLLVRIK